MMTVKTKKALLLAGLALCALGLAAWIGQLTLGLRATTDMSNSFCWGLMIAVFAFLVGFGAGSQLVASYIVLARRQSLLPYVPVAQAVALAGAIGAAVAVMADLGSIRNIFSMVLSPKIGSPLTWDMVALTLFILVAVVGLVAVLRDSPRVRLWMALGAVCAVALQLIEGMLFALQGARAWWHSVLMPVDFLAVAVVCGLALALVACALLPLQQKQSALGHLRVLLCWALGAHLVLALADLALVALKGTPSAASTLQALAAYAPLYAADLGLPLLALVLLLAWRKGPTAGQLVACGGLAIVGIFCHRLMLLYPAYASSTLFAGMSNAASAAYPYPVSTGLAANVAFQMAPGYVPTAIEWASALLPVGLAVAIVAAALLLAPRIAGDKAAHK